MAARAGNEGSDHNGKTPHSLVVRVHWLRLSAVAHANLIEIMITPTLRLQRYRGSMIQSPQRIVTTKQFEGDAHL
jgi:hypothetical protein